MGVRRIGKSWYIDYYYPPGRGGRRIREKVGTKDEAEIVLGERLQDIRMGRNPELRRIKPVLFRAHAADVLAQHYAHRRCQGWAKIVIERHLNPHFGDRFLTEIDERMISDYIARRAAAGRKNSTINHERAVLGKALTLAVQWKRIPENPVRSVKKLEATPGRLRYLTHDEADQLITHAPLHLRPVIITALETGGRLSEVLGLRWEDVDFERGILYFDQTNTKSGKQREIPMTPTLVATLEERRRIREFRARRRGRVDAAAEWVFTWHGKRLRDVRTSFEVAKRRAGLGADVTFHTLRHTFASWYVMRGFDVYRLQRLMGHADLKMTERYAHLAPDYLRAAVAAMGRQPEAAAPARRHQVGNESPAQEAATVQA